MGAFLETIKDAEARREAGKQYARAVERHFDAAHRLVLEGKPEDAEAVAKAAVVLRTTARYELVVP